MMPADLTGSESKELLRCQRLLLDSQELSTRSTAEEAGLKEGAKLRVSLKPQRTRLLYVQKLTGWIFDMTVCFESTTILDVKIKLYELGGEPNSRMCLISIVSATWRGHAARQTEHTTDSF